MDHETVIRDLATHEARVAELERRLEGQKGWTQGEIDSLMHSLNETSQSVVELRAALFGPPSGKDFMSRLQRLEKLHEVEEATERRKTRRLWAVLMMVLGAAISYIVAILGRLFGQHP